MDLVVDANILFSALIKDNIAAKLLFEDKFKLYTPDYILDEFLKYNKTILKKTSRTHENFVQIMHVLQEIIYVLPREEYSKFIDKAEKISPDEKDVMYFALALKLKCPIWSNDKKLKEQKEVVVYSTHDLVKIFII
ncbi:PIN domain-containing protein [Candidatus Woesearchaeota archaeon]|nr:PIN domain-containing protein [Candidatus Woesearchaeota archaeon]